jgi:antitoxin ParD1/3/4
MNINLTPELDQLVHDKVNSGFYNSASEVIREALRLMQERDEIRAARIEQLKKEIDIGYQQYLRGEGAPLDIDAVMEDVRNRIASKRKAS